MKAYALSTGVAPAFAVCLLLCSPVFAGGGGQNMLMIINPDDENAVRIANAYQQIRGIPDRNIMFITPPTNHGIGDFTIYKNELVPYYLAPIAQAIEQRGLTNQIDYIGVLGQPERYRVIGTSTGDNANSLTYGLSLLTPISQGLDPDHAVRAFTRLYQSPSNIAIGNNPAIHHSQEYLASYPRAVVQLNTQYYMSGVVGFTGIDGNTPDQVIASLARAASADGTKPVGTVYFEENDDVRSNIREHQWNATKVQLTTRGINWVQSRNTIGSTPLNRPDVRGAVTGRDTLILPNGSTYLPGSWADNLTSYGGTWGDGGQTKIPTFIAAGAAATTGAVVEPYGIESRFTNSSIHTFIADGSTLMEAFYKSVFTPDIQLFLGDMLAQPYADVPHVQIISGPAEGAQVSGPISLGAQASLSNPTIATGVRQLELYVDGREQLTTVGGNGSFDVDTAGLSDGWHELRVVAVNDAAAESESYVVRNIFVNNHGRSVAVEGDSLTFEAKQVGSISVNASAGDGAVARVELRHLGRILGQITGSGGNVPLDATKLGYGDNRIVPVAVYSDGTEVAGEPITVHRNVWMMPGQTPTEQAHRIPGFKAEFFEGQGRTTIAASTFEGTPDAVQMYSRLSLGSGLRDANGNYYSVNNNPSDMMPGVDIDQLSVRITSNFNIAADQTGEYQFFFYKSMDSVQLFIDGEAFQGFDNFESSTPILGSDMFLDAGQHEFMLLAANVVRPGYGELYFDLGMYYRGPDGITRLADSSFFYAAVPEPTSGALILIGAIGLMRRRRGPEAFHHRVVVAVAAAAHARHDPFSRPAGLIRFRASTPARVESNRATDVLRQLAQAVRPAAAANCDSRPA